ncbi:hypothetical protein GSI_08534 [Ganoderma sinense ZZ0214-1]|uniref:Uncharacterized protein n=1 Tax=Ganoderma sinense ZZ0214-1 TaxID=1077348 RepID=A0A2G8S3Z4_9APHY|nr:hypothetical protein GSI_08534 [Ganoderma sinense ZZ0214-1]
MHPPCQAGHAASRTLIAARTTSGQRVGNNDPGIQYSGAWVRKSFSDDPTLEALIGTNVSGSTASYNFKGTGISVYGAFPLVGTFSLHSSYSIDKGKATVYLPPDTIKSPTFHQPFFQSDTLPNEEHTLVITNAGEEYWLLYLYVTQSASSSSTTTAGPTTTPKAEPTSSNTTLPSPTNTATTSSTAQLQTSQSIFSDPLSLNAHSQSISSSLSQGTHSSSTAENTALTSTDATVAPSQPTSQSQTSALTSATSPTSTPPRAHSTKIPAGAIAGFAVASFLALVVVGLIGYIWRRRKESRTRRRDSLPPHGEDPGQTTPACESSEKRDLARDNNTNSFAADATSRSASEGGAPHEIRPSDLDGMLVGREGRTVFEPTGSPSAASSLILRHPQRTRERNGHRVTLSIGSSRYVSLREERRSVDGGVRLAGGPPAGVGQQDPFDDRDDVRDGMSALPPAYQVYPAA